MPTHLRAVNGATEGRDAGIRAVFSAAGILHPLATERDGASVASGLGLSRSTAQRLLQALNKDGQRQAGKA